MEHTTDNFNGNQTVVFAGFTNDLLAVVMQPSQLDAVQTPINWIYVKSSFVNDFVPLYRIEVEWRFLIKFKTVFKSM